MIRAIAVFVIGCVIAVGFMAAPASANTMNGKPTGRNAARYDNPTKKPPAKMKKPATAK